MCAYGVCANREQHTLVCVCVLRAIAQAAYCCGCVCAYGVCAIVRVGEVVCHKETAVHFDYLSAHV